MPLVSGRLVKSSLVRTRLVPAGLSGIDLSAGNVIPLWSLGFAGSVGNGINFGSSAALDNLADNEFTVDGWFKYTGILTSSSIIEKGNHVTGWEIYLTGAGTIRFNVFCAVANTTTVTATSKADSLWHHFASYFNDTGDRKAYLAVDGTWAAIPAAGNGAIVADAADNLYSANRGGGPWPWTGNMGWLRISNNDRLNHGVNFAPPARSVMPVADANTIELWKMNQGAGLTAIASIDIANNGTITAGTWVQG